jgi:predicted MFS family arabinose efflux permease
MSRPHGPSPLFAVFWPFAFGYALSYALRTINAVLSPSLVQELGLSAAELGLLASAYFLSFAAMQIPLGVLLDRYGPRRVEGSLLIIALLGACLTAMANDFWMLWIGRALIGAGVSACLMAGYKAFRMLFEDRLQAPLASAMLVVGSIGALSATLPVEWLLQITSWRGVFWILALLFGFSALAIAWLLPPIPIPGSPTGGPPKGLWADTRDGLDTIFSHHEFWRMLPFAVVTFGGFLALHGLWLGPWFRVVEGFSNAEAAWGLFVLTLGVTASHLTVASLAGRVIHPGPSLFRFMVGGLLMKLVFSTSAVLGLWPHPLIGWGLTFLAAGVTTLSYTRFALVFPKALSGRASTSFNFLVFMGAFAVQWGLGLLIDLFRGFAMQEADAMRLAFGFWVGLQAAALLWLIRPGQPAYQVHVEDQSPGPSPAPLPDRRPADQPESSPRV